MNWKIVKIKWNIAKVLCITGTLFWIIETIYFLIVYGFHWKAINEAENMCDNIVGLFWTGGIVFAIIVMIDVIEYLLTESKLNNKTN